MNSHDKISRDILTHWQNYQPAMLEQFRQEGTLEEELEATAKRFTDLLCELVVEQKMSYPAGWEIAIHELLEAEEESSSMSRNQS